MLLWKDLLVALTVLQQHMLMKVQPLALLAHFQTALSVKIQVIEIHALLANQAGTSSNYQVTMDVSTIVHLDIILSLVI